MIAIFLIIAVCQVQCRSGTLIFIAPSAVSHQSRIDIKHIPGYIASPIVYNPISTIYTSGSIAAQEAILTPILPTDTLLTPVALSFFHNLPLARALEHPISVDKTQEESNIEINTMVLNNLQDQQIKDANKEIISKITDRDKTSYEKLDETSATKHNNDGLTMIPLRQTAKNKL